MPERSCSTFFIQGLTVVSSCCKATTHTPGRAKRFAYIDRGFYSGQLKRLWVHFPAAQTLIFKNEQLLDEPAAVLTRIAEFLRIAPFPSLDARTRNTREYNATMSAEEKRYLSDLYAEEIRELEQLLGWDCSTWLA